MLAIGGAGLAGYRLNLGPPVAALSLDLIDFGEVAMGSGSPAAEVRVRNVGERPLAIGGISFTGTAAADFELGGGSDGGCAGVLAAGEECAVEVTFRPSAAGRRQARLTLVSDSAGGTLALPLLGAGTAPALGFTPAELDFGLLKVGDAAAAQRLTLRNDGRARLEVRTTELRGDGAADFVIGRDGCSRRSLAAGESCALEVAFLPTVPGPRRARIWIDSDAELPSTLPSLVGRGQPLVPLLRLEPDQLVLGSTPVGALGAPAEARLTNVGDAPLSIRELVLSGGSDAFVVAAEVCLAAPLAPGDGCVLTVSPRPPSEGETRDFLEIRHSGESALHLLALSATGSLPHARVAPGRLAFEEVAIGSSSAPRPVTLTNTGGAPLRLDDVRLGGADAASFSARLRGCDPASVAPDASCTVEVRFQPRRSGPHRAELILSHDADSGSDRLALLGLGTAGRLVVEPSRIDFGEVEAGTEARRSMQLANRGRAPLQVSRLRLAGASGSGMVLTEDGCTGHRLVPGNSCRAVVTLSAARAGSRRVEIRAEHDAGDPLRIEVAATVIPRRVPEISVAPGDLEFGEVALGAKSEILTVEVRNPGSGELSLGEIALAGDAAGEYQLVAGTCDGARYIAPGGSCTVGVRFAPVSEGLRRARLTLRHNAATATVEVAVRGWGAPGWWQGDDG